jgi:hypothetical protein
VARTIGDRAQQSRQLQEGPQATLTIVDVELVCVSERERPLVSASALASALGAVFGSSPGRTWVRVRFLSSSAYAENDCAVSPEQLPVFVTVLQARLPVGEALTQQVHQSLKQ